MPRRNRVWSRAAETSQPSETNAHGLLSPLRQTGRDLAEVLSDFARTMATDFPIQGILDQLVQRTVDILPITGAGVTLISPGTPPRYVAASNSDALQYEQLQTDLGEGPCIAAYESGSAVLAPDLTAEERFPVFTPRALAAGLAAVFTFPLHHEAARLGALDLYRDSPGPLANHSISAAQTLADVAAAYLLNAQAREELQLSATSSHAASLHDPLTGLPNRTLMSERLEHAILLARRSSKTAALFFIDLDHFKEVNDSYGPGAGDELLIRVAERLSSAVRPSDTVARMSGGGFVILCETLNDPSLADTILRRVEQALSAAPFLIDGYELNVTASISTAVDAGGKDLPAELLRGADQTTYRAKRRDSNADAPAEAEDTDGGIIEALRGAADRGELRLDFQPIVDTHDRRLTGAEALLRWTHPDYGSIPPLKIVPLAEQSGQILELGRWILQQAWAEREGWKAQPQRQLAVSVNVSVHQLLAAGFADMVATVLLARSSDPQWLTLEVTEGAFVEDTARATVVLTMLKNMGVRLAIDDFGTGLSSLGQLLAYPVDTIKVDQTFVAKLGQSNADSATVTALIELGHNLGMSVVCEGVETARQHDQLARLGSDFCQGFYFARPMPSGRLTTLIRDDTNGNSPRLPAPDALS